MIFLFDVFKGKKRFLKALFGEFYCTGKSHMQETVGMKEYMQYWEEPHNCWNYDKTTKLSYGYSCIDNFLPYL